MATKKREYGVKQVRGPVLELDPHPDACRTEDELANVCQRLREGAAPPLLAADLFAGAGGLSLGLEQAGIQVVLSVDHEKFAVETHRHHFPGLTVDWDLHEPANIKRVSELMRENSIEVLAGGPPCQPFSKAGRSLIRHMVRSGLREPQDRRRDLWRTYLEVVKQVRPRAVIMENVPDMALDREMFILRSMVFELEQMGYAVEAQIVEARRYGVPQFRQRLILVALADGVRYEWPAGADEVSLDGAIADLPAVEGGWRPDGGAHGWAEYSGPSSPFQDAMRSGVDAAHSGRVYDQITRPVREDDRAAFALMDATTKYSDLPKELKRYRDDIFDDKYKRLDGSDLSRTITAHIAKDGYWYIHPREDRTITVREAARIQTFPDQFRFAGPPSAAFRQIGNAVPPKLGEGVGGGVLAALRRSELASLNSESLSGLLADWFEKEKEKDELSIPWLAARNRFQVLAAEQILHRASDRAIRAIWPILAKMPTPGALLFERENIETLGGWMKRRERVDSVIALAETLINEGRSGLSDHDLSDLVEAKRIPKTHADLSALVVGGGEDESEEPVIVSRGVLRVAARFTGEPVDLRNRLTDGRIAAARMVGFGFGARSAHLALIELASSVCRPKAPICIDCPLGDLCSESLAEEQRASVLPGMVGESGESQGAAQLG